jgi:hypothetical protein
VLVDQQETFRGKNKNTLQSMRLQIIHRLEALFKRIQALPQTDVSIDGEDISAAKLGFRYLKE